MAGVLFTGTLVALLLRRDRLVAWCALGLLGPIVFHVFLARVVLPSYWTLWTPPFFALAAMGWAHALARLRTRGGGAGRTWSVLATSAVLAVPLAAATGESVRVATVRPTGTAALRA